MRHKIFATVVGPNIPLTTGAVLDYPLPNSIANDINAQGWTVVSHTALPVPDGLLITLFCSGEA